MMRGGLPSLRARAIRSLSKESNWPTLASQGGGDVQRILRTQRVVVPNQFARSLSMEAGLRERSNTQTT